MGVLMSHGSDPNALDYQRVTPLHMAAYVGSIELASILLANGADANVQAAGGKTPVDIARQENHLPFVEFVSNYH